MLYIDVASPSPDSSMAQLVPCSGVSPVHLMPQDSSSSSSINSSSGGGSLGLFEFGTGSSPLAPYGGQTVPSSPTFSSSWNCSPPSYWSDWSPTQVQVKCEPVGTLEELLDDYTYEPTTPPAKAAAGAGEGHALLRQCLFRPPVADDGHLQFLNQIGSVIASSTSSSSSSSSSGIEMTTIKTEKTTTSSSASSFWNQTVPSSNNNNNTAQGLASVLTLVMEQVNEEVRSTCEILGVHPNPSQWSAEDVRAWLLWTSRQCALGSFPLERFQMEGAALAVLTEEEFRSRAPQGGDTLYAKLDIWRSAWNQRKSAATATAQPPSVPTIQVDEPVTDMSELFSWMNSTQDLQSTSSSSLLSAPHFLAVPSPSSTSSQRGALSPYSDHTHSGSEDMASEVEEVDEEDEVMNDVLEERAASSASNRPTPSPNGSHIHLWQFLKELLSQPTVHGSAIRWLDRQRGVFKIEDSVRVARLWGKRKNRPAMNYDKLSRSIRQYYRKGIMKKTERSQRLVYQFCHPYAL